MGGTGILGGTFNPVHTGHIRHAIEVGESLGLDRVYLSPSSTPPHKPGVGILPYELRLAMVEAAVEGIPLLAATGVEGDIDGPSYTFTIMEAWRRMYPEDGRPYFMMGVEDFAQLDTWHRGLELPTVCNLVIVPRAGSDTELFQATVKKFWPHGIEWGKPEPDGRQEITVTIGDIGRRCFYLPVPRLDISSSFIRSRWKAGREIAGLTPHRVIAVMRAAGDIAERVWSETE